MRKRSADEEVRAELISHLSVNDLEFGFVVFFLLSPEYLYQVLF